MKIRTVSISEGCIFCGACVEICPEVFILDKECKVAETIDFDFFREWVEQAMEVCPVGVIQVH